MSDSSKEYIIRFYPENCIQCHGCETACKMWRGLPYGVRFRRVFNLWENEFPNVKNSTLSLACLHCVEPACMEACPVGALSKRVEDGLVLVDENLCIGCRKCLKACPYNVPQFGEDRRMQKCDLCFTLLPKMVNPPCVDTCPGNALVLELIEKSEKKEVESSVLNAFRKRSGIESPG